MGLVPEAQLIIAQHFSAGKVRSNIKSRRDREVEATPAHDRAISTPCGMAIQESTPEYPGGSVTETLSRAR